MPQDPRSADLLRAAFRDVHGPRLHGFALLLTLGDRPRAAAVAGRAMAAGMNRAADLRHPERAAAWLRARVLREVKAGGWQLPAVGERHAALAEIGLAEPATDALSELSIDERGALIAGTIEGLDLADVATILGSNPARARRRLTAARTRYLVHAGRRLQTMPSSALPSGVLSRRVQETAAWVVGPRPSVEVPHD